MSVAQLTASSHAVAKPKAGESQAGEHSTGLLFSVIIPFGDPRAMPEHLDSWMQQTFANERFEVIVVANPKVTNVAKLRERVRPHDRLLCVDAACPFPMYAAGAKEARGEILFFTEDHCLGDPDCLEAAAKFLEDKAYAGATVRWRHINRTVVARMEELVNEADSRTWFEPGHWNNLRIRGFALRRESYHEVGGIQSEYGRFAEAVLAARLHAQGHSIGFVHAAGVQHINTYTLSEIRKNARNYTLSECAYCTSHDEPFCERYFSAPSTLASFRQPSAQDVTRQRRDLGLVLSEALRGHWPGWRTGLQLLGESMHGRSAGLRNAWARLRLPAKMLISRVGFALFGFREAWRLRAFKAYWQAVVQAARIEYFARHPTPDRGHSPLTPNGDGEIPLEQLPRLYPIEIYRGTRFRWTPPVAMFCLRLPAGQHLVEIDTRGFRGPASRLKVSLVWNRRPVPRSSMRADETSISFAVDSQINGAETDQFLTIVIPAMLRLGTRERRRLGMPIAALHIRPMAAGDRR